MERLTFHPENRDAWLALRSHDLTSTTIPALFGLSDRITAFELWHRVKGNLEVDLEDNASMRWGRRLEPVIAMGIAEDEGWNIRPKTEYMRLPEHRIGSSFDFETDAPALLEIKSVSSLAFRRGYMETDFGLEAPPSVEIQAQVEMLVSGIAVCYIGVLSDNHTVHVLRREADDVIAAKILDAAAEFWARTEPPAPDFRQDAETIARLYGYSSAGKIIDADAEVTQLLAEYYEAGARKREYEAMQDEAKARLLLKIGDAEKVHSEIGTLSCGMVKAAHIEYDRKEYRSFKFSPRRE